MTVDGYDPHGIDPPHCVAAKTRYGQKLRVNIGAKNMILRALVCGSLLIGALSSARAADNPAMPGLPDLQVPFSDLTPTMLLSLGKTADWVQFAGREAWVAASDPDAAYAIDLKTQKILATVKLPGRACAGLTAAFGSLWAPLCGTSAGLARINLKTHRLEGILKIGPGIAEAGIAASRDSLWMPLDDQGTLARIDPKRGRVLQVISLPPGSLNPLYHDGTIWVTSGSTNCVTAIEARSAKILACVPTGPKPHFLTFGQGSIWTLNQGDGSVTRIDATTRRATAHIPLGLPGPGGDIAFGENLLWVTMLNIPLTVIDPATNLPLRQWIGTGGDSMRVGSKGIWLTDYRAGTIARFAVPVPLP